jgi:hypothetical protein
MDEKDRRFKDLRALKPSFGSLENPILVNVIKMVVPSHSLSYWICLLQKLSSWSLKNMKDCNNYKTVAAQQYSFGSMFQKQNILKPENVLRD